MAELARARSLEAERRRLEADLAATLARELLAGSGHPSTRSRSPPTGSRRPSVCPRPAIELGVARRRRAAPRRSRCVTRTAPRSRRCWFLACSRPTSTSASRTRIVPTLAAIVAIALRRDAIQAEAVETAALRRSDDVKTALLRAVSHDLRTPLTAIVAAGHALALPLAQREDRAELCERRRRRGRAARSAGRQAARPLAPPGRRRRPAPGLGLDRGRRPGGARGARRARRTTCESTVAPDLPEVRADAAQLERVFANLLENASAVRGRRAGRRQRRRLSAAASSSASSTRGRGSRRPIASGSSSRSTAAPRDGRRALVRLRTRARDRARVSSRPAAARSRSSRCQARAPASSSRSRSTRGTRRRRGRRPAPGCAGRGRRARMSDGARHRVLVCDDEQQILRALRVILRDAGYEALPASTVEEALDVAAVGRPDAAIIDLSCPTATGSSCAAGCASGREIPVIVLSAIGDEDAKVRALAAGADDYVTKPFGPRELIARLEANLRRIGGDAEPLGRRGRRPRDRSGAARSSPRWRGGPSDTDRVRASARSWRATAAGC